jgi:SAM-dependent methyltransferase
VGVPDLDQAAAMRWIGRWDGQQNSYLPDREERFTALIDAVEAEAGRPDPLVLDLGSGPGSLAVRLLDRMPAATVMAIDTDPLLLALGQAAYPARTGLRFTDLDLRVPGWGSRLGLTRLADAAVSTTALHWLAPPALDAMYAELATVLRPGGLLLDGDHLTEDPAVAPTLARLDEALTRRITERGTGHGTGAAAEHGTGHGTSAGPPEDWQAWWQAATADPALAGPAAERQRRRLSEDHHGSESVLLARHVSALAAAGFSEIGVIWQHGENRILAAVRAG